MLYPSLYVVAHSISSTGKNFGRRSRKRTLITKVAKAGGDKWKSLTEEEKAPYVAKAAKLKADYTKTMTAYNKGQVLITNSPLFV
ncbi:hypothetical protein ZIOFF_032229 [Zingiber officinale]|uniref:HMG box domain-containing protein n=1 Tax=Zingiber officinale TaxID=94328 RepID=A0A8J5GG47_ZINOF|nr:hypothetical protein ZIOFF_032229 [Zingiber officinale]